MKNNKEKVETQHQKTYQQLYEEWTKNIVIDMEYFLKHFQHFYIKQLVGHKNALATLIPERLLIIIM